MRPRFRCRSKMIVGRILPQALILPAQSASGRAGVLPDALTPATFSRKEKTFSAPPRPLCLQGVRRIPRALDFDLPLSR
jgi:hypothetical protein